METCLLRSYGVEVFHILFLFITVILIVGDKDMWIVGNIIFPNNVGRLLRPSCMVIKLQGISFPDTFSNIIGFQEVELYDIAIGKSLWYEIKSKKPVDQHIHWRYIIGIVVNVGWCQTKTSHPWARKGDYLSVKEHEITLKKNVYRYEVDVQLECYGKCYFIAIKQGCHAS